jgi:predicted Zn-dependent protease
VRPRRPSGLHLILVLLLSACAARIEPIGLDGRAFTPEADERQLWARAERDAAVLRERVPRLEDAALIAYLAGLVERLAPPGATVTGAPLTRITLLRDPTLAAFALPDGQLFVHTGLVAAVEREAQLALVLARELAHVHHRHALARWRENRVGPPRVVAVTAVSPTAAAILGGGLPVAALGAMTGYGQRLEARADAVALLAVARGGWDPREAVTLWSTLAADLPVRGPLEAFLPGQPRWLRARGGGLDEHALAAAVPAAPGGDELETRRLALLRDNAGEDLRRGRFALARRQLDRVLAATPDDARAQLAYGELHRLQSQRAATYEERVAGIRRARARYVRALALDPALAEAHRQQGLLAYQQQSFGRARAALEEYLRGAPTAPDAGRVAEYVRELGR